MLGNLRFRGKLTLLVALPLLAFVLLTVPWVTSSLDRAERAEEIRHTAALAHRVAGIVSELRQERLLSLGFLFDVVDRPRLVAQSAQVNDEITELTLDAGEQGTAPDGLPEPVTAALADARALAQLREPLLRGEIPAEQVLAEFGAASDGLVNSLRLLDGVDLGTPSARQLAALDTALRINEAASQATDLLLIIGATDSTAAAAEYAARLRLVDDHIARFSEYATADQLAQLELMSGAYTARDVTGAEVAFAEDPREATAGRSTAELFPPLESLSQLGRFVEGKVATDVLIEVEGQHQTALRGTYVVTVGAVLVVLLVVGLTAALARAVVGPVLSLTSSAHRVAGAAETELARIADEESDDPAPVRIDPVQVSGRDEIADLGRAFDRVRETAVQLVERQASSRRNVGLMLGYLGRRTQNLVGRQIALIDQLERDETDPDRLSDLYRLDHISSRLHRNAGSLTALAGTVGADEYTAPLPLTDVVRLALGQIEDFRRVDVEVPATVVVVPAVVSDLVLVLAELMENATTFSPPDSRVTVSAVATGSGAMVSIVDHGIGMSASRLAEENARLGRRERLDLAPTEVLGLFVVGRLSRRHGLGVSLAETTGGGVTAVVDLPRSLLAGAGQPQLAGAAAAPALADSGAGATAGIAAGPAAPRSAAPAPAADTGPPLTVLPHLDSDLVDVTVLGKASQVVAQGRRWNAFAVPLHDPPEPAGAPAPAREPHPDRTPGGDWAAPTTPQPTTPQPASGNGSRPAPPASPAGGDHPPAAGGSPAQPAAGGSASAHAGAPPVGSPAPRTAGADPAPAPEDGDAASGSADAAGGAEAAGSDSLGRVAGRASVGPSGLRRRVPGAALAAEGIPRQRRPEAADPSRPKPRTGANPEAARALIEQVQSGVARALHDIATPSGTEDRHDDHK